MTESLSRSFTTQGPDRAQDQVHRLLRESCVITVATSNRQRRRQEASQHSSAATKREAGTECWRHAQGAGFMKPLILAIDDDRGTCELLEFRPA